MSAFDTLLGGTKLSGIKQARCLLFVFQKDKNQTGGWDGTGRGMEENEGRAGGRREASKASLMKFHKVRYLKFSRIGRDNCSFLLHAQKGPFPPDL